MKKKLYSFVLFVFLGGLIFPAAIRAQTATQLPAQTLPPNQPRPSLAKPTLPAEDMLTTIRRKNRLDVGLSTFVPWAMRNKKGELIGFEVEIAKKLADDLGVRLQLHPVGFGDIIGDLNNNRFDIIVTGMYPTPQRALFVNFSEPYNDSKIELVASRDKMGNRGDFKDYNKADVTIGIVRGTVYAEYIAENFPAAKVQAFNDEAELVKAVADGRIEAMIASMPAPEIAMRVYPGKLYRPLADPLGKLGESFAIRRGDMDFLNYLNTWIRYHEQTGWLKQERKYWFDSTEWAKEL